MARKSRKQPKLKRPLDSISLPEVRTGAEPARSDTQTIAWKLSTLDVTGPWGWKSIPPDKWWDKLLQKLQAFESMTWAEIKQASGGRTRGTNHHSINTTDLSRKAMERLRKIGQADVDSVFFLRLDNTTRIYGIRHGRILRVLWYDPYHGDNSKAVVPTRKR